jgi:hypothetical protein
MRRRSGLLEDTKSTGPKWRRPKAGARKNKKARKHREDRRKTKRWLDRELVAVEGECQAEREHEAAELAQLQEDFAIMDQMESEEEIELTPDEIWEDEQLFFELPWEEYHG